MNDSDMARVLDEVVWAFISEKGYSTNAGSLTEDYDIGFGFNPRKKDGAFVGVLDAVVLDEDDFSALGRSIADYLSGFDDIEEASFSRVKEYHSYPAKGDTLYEMTIYVIPKEKR